MNFRISAAERRNVGFKAGLIEPAEHLIELFAEEKAHQRHGQLLKLDALTQPSARARRSVREFSMNAAGRKSPLNYDIASWDDLERWFFTQIGLQRRFRMTRGCPFGTIGNEVTENDELIRQDLSLIFEVARSKIATFFVKEKASGRLDPDVREDHLADFCLATIQGAMLMGKVKRSSQLVESVAHEAMAHLRGYAQVPT